MRPKADTAPSALSEARQKADRKGAPENRVEAKLQDLYDLIHRRVPDPAPGSWRTRISHIPVEIVGDALQSLAAKTVTRGSLVRVAAGNRDLITALHDVGDEPLDRDTARAQIPEELHEAFDRAWAEAEQVVTIHDLEMVLEDNPALLARVRAAARGLTGSEAVLRARGEIERWFEGSMDALSRFYRRQNRKLVAFIALPIVLVANADAFDLVNRLRQDQDLRAAAATAAADWAAAPLADTETGELDLEAVCERVTEAGDAEEGDAEEGDAVADEAAESDDAAADDAAAEPDAIAESRRRFQCAGNLFASSDVLGPIGPQALWREIRAADDGDCLACDLVAWSYEGLIGRIATWLALLFGASFWYDALRRLIGLKGKLAGGSSG
jgi:hypothetical protein